MLSYSDWYDKIGYHKQQELENWLDEMPDLFDLKDNIDVEDEIINLYDSMLSDYEDRKYDEYKDSLLC